MNISTVWIWNAPKGPYVKGLIANLWYCWEVREPLGCGPKGRKLGHWSVPFKGTSGHFPLLSLMRAVSSSLCSCHDILCNEKPKSKGPRKHEPKPLKLSHTKNFLLSFFLVELGFQFRVSSLQGRYFIPQATPPVPFALVILEMEDSQTIFLGWPQTTILLIAASREARSTGMRHQHLANFCFL
jgi:hypothetical protein